MKTINIEEELKKPLPEGVIYDPISKAYIYMCHCVICGREMGNSKFSKEDVVLAEAGMKTILCKKCGGEGENVW